MLSLQRFRPAGLLATVTVAAIAAATITVVLPEPSPSTATPAIAGASMMQVLRDEHALAGAQSGARAQAMQVANREADADLAQMKLMAARESAQRVAELQGVAAPPMRLTTAVPTPPNRQAMAQMPQREPRLDRVLYTPGPALQEPLQLMPAPLPAAPEERGVRSRMRAVVSSVTRIPGWFGQVASNAANHAADWVVELPGRAIPDRRFFSVSL